MERARMAFQELSPLHVYHIKGEVSRKTDPQLLVKMCLVSDLPASMVRLAL